MASGSSLTRKLERGNQDYIVIMVLSYRLNAVVINLSLVANSGLINDSTNSHHTGGQHVAIKLLLREKLSVHVVVFVCSQPLGQSQGR